MWKFHDFSITQTLREFNFGNSKSAKAAISTHLDALNLDFYKFLYFLKAEIYNISKIQRPLNGKNGRFRTSSLSKIDFT